VHVERRFLLALTAAALAVTSLTAPVAVAAPAHTATRDFGNGPERNEVAASDPVAVAASPAGENTAGARQGYPRRTHLRVYPDNPADRSIKLGLTPYHAIAPRLNVLQTRSDRVSVEVVGQTGLGRDLYLVTLTAPETARETRQQDAWRALIENDPRRAASDRGLDRGYKAPVWINNNIHGNEWEGTDASLRQIEYLATTDDRPRNGCWTPAGSTSTSPRTPTAAWRAPARTRPGST
jgi:zinc carboxypeptidase